MFRRALRQSGVPPIPRNMIWVGVRLAAIFSGRLGQKGPKWYRKVLSVLMWTLVGLVIVAAPVVAIVAGYSVCWVFGLLAALATAIYAGSRSRGNAEYQPEQTFPRFDLGKSEARKSKGCVDHLLVIAKPRQDAGPLSVEQLVEPETELSELLDRYLDDYKKSGSKLWWKDSAEAQELQRRSQCAKPANRQPQ